MAARSLLIHTLVRILRTPYDFTHLPRYRSIQLSVRLWGRSNLETACSWKLQRSFHWWLQIRCFRYLDPIRCANASSEPRRSS